MRADVAKPRRAEQRVANRVRQSVTVGVSHRPLVERNFDATEDKFAAFRKAVKIMTDPRAGHGAARSSRREYSASCMSPGRVSFKLRSEPATTSTSRPMR